MSFKKKQVLGFGLVLIFFAIILTGFIFMLNDLKAKMNEIVEDRYNKVSSSMEIRQMLYQTDRELLNLMTGAKGREAESSIAIINQNHEMVTNEIIKLSGILNRNKSKQLLGEIEILHNSNKELSRKIIAKHQAGGSAAEFSSLRAEQSAQRQHLLGTVEEFKEYQESLMKDSFTRAEKTYDNAVSLMVAASALILLLVALTAYWVIKSTTKSLTNITDVIQKVNFEDLTDVPKITKVTTKDEIGQIANAFNEMAGSLESYNKKEQDFKVKIEEQNWVQTRLADIATMYQRIIDVEILAENTISKLSRMMGASMGVFYIKKGNGERTRFVRQASFAGEGSDAGVKEFMFGQGLIGQSAFEKTIQMIEVPEDYTWISSALGRVKPKSLLIAPVIFEDEVIGMVELASVQPFTELQQRFVSRVLDTLGIALNNVQGRMEIERLLKESQAQTEELQVQSEELQSQSEELQAQSEEMQTQSEELRMINEQLEERNREVEERSHELEKAKADLEFQAEQLKLSSKYKSEFLANMSHELRTPLNSIVILSEMMTHPDEELSAEHREFARVINSSGQDLLALINDILDLSKVEVGKLQVEFNETNLAELPAFLQRNFSPIVKHKGIDFSIKMDDDIPGIFYTDEQRMQQIIKNLLSNAFKFTEQGSVAVNIRKADEVQVSSVIETSCADNWVEVTVTDTGIGIPKDKQKLIFEAFQQVDGASMRKYGGTGLGLSICREFARLLGGCIHVESEVGKGSTFTLFIPSLPNGLPTVVEEAAAASDLMTEQTISPLDEAESEEAEVEEPIKEQNTPSRSAKFAGKTVLIVDDDNRNIFALKHVLKQEGMNILTASNGLECLKIMDKPNNIDIVLLDIMMPEMDGYETMRRIRSNSLYEELPIVALTAKAMKGDREKCMQAGASDYISKPLNLDQLLSVLRVWLSN
ncbi:hybrid sensor histidine kinase/response regulator [Bacillus sp. M6-12]|uniref:sensor histidine kinase n=1 Tax=Bacillus sp. M6-12 TaxID=2054166 RepID=UPI000C77D205|nr:ATP-binding protein [Bacillus sp. M6-12]PLS15873.1 hybrid sensor histidine kinase/response regulator [Bacillus sp. M6-12]